MTPPSPHIPRWTAAVVFAALSFAHALVLPTFEGMDEPAHLSSILQFATGHGRPEPDKARLHATVERAISLAPGPYEQWTDLRETIGATTYPEWRRLPSEEQQRRRRELDALRVDQWRDSIRENWKAQHPPLYYALVGELVLGFGGGSFVRSHLVARLASAAMFATTGIMLTVFLVTRWGASPLSVLFVCLFPMWYVMGARISNDPLAIPAFGLASLLAIDQLRRPPSEWSFAGWFGAGCAGALALAAKAYGLAFLPVAVTGVVIAVVQGWRGDALPAASRAGPVRGAALRRTALWRTAFWKPALWKPASWKPALWPTVAILVTLAPNAWWLAENQANTGFITGQNENADLVARGVVSLADRVPYAVQLVVEQPRVLVSTLARATTQALYVSNWTFGAAPVWFYPLQLLALGLAVAAARRRRTPILWAAAVVAIITVGTIVVGSAKAVLDFYILFGETRLARGWYVWGGGVALAAALALAFDTASARVRRFVIALQVVCLLTAVATDVMFWSGHYTRHPQWRTPVAVSADR